MLADMANASAIAAAAETARELRRRNTIAAAIPSGT